MVINVVRGTEECGCVNVLGSLCEVMFVNTRLNKVYWASYSYSLVCEAVCAGWLIPTYRSVLCHNLIYRSKNRHYL